MRRTNRLIQGVSILLAIAVVIAIVWSLFTQIRSSKLPVERPLHQKVGHYLDRKQNKKVSFAVPFHIDKISLDHPDASSTRVFLELTQLDSEEIFSRLEGAVYTIELHTSDAVVIYTHNFQKTGFLKIEGVAADDKVFVVRRRGAVPVAEGTLHFENDQKKMILIQVPVRFTESDVKAVYFRYLPSVEAAKKARTRPPVVSGIFFQRGRFDTRMPGLPYR